MVLSTVGALIGIPMSCSCSLRGLSIVQPKCDDRNATDSLNIYDSTTWKEPIRGATERKNTLPILC